MLVSISEKREELSKIKTIKVIRSFQRHQKLPYSQVYILYWKLCCHETNGIKCNNWIKYNSLWYPWKCINSILVIDSEWVCNQDSRLARLVHVPLTGTVTIVWGHKNKICLCKYVGRIQIYILYYILLCTISNIRGFFFSGILDFVFIFKKLNTLFWSWPPKVSRIACQDPKGLLSKKIKALRRKKYYF